jgi:4-diphosphocytidyl-2-C-methyl-D-erythritol kinase
MIVFPNCKINIGLYVTSKRADGYHSLESLFFPVPWYDVLEVVHQSDEGITWSSSGLPIQGDSNDNLCVKAYRLMQERHGITGVQAHLHKLIPMGAGLGGGSSNAAFMLKALNSLFALQLSEPVLESYAAELGSDCPFFVRNRPAFVTGRGEILQPSSLSLSGLHIVLLHPKVHISTAQAFQRLTPRPAPYCLQDLAALPHTEWQQRVSNDFEPAMFSDHPSVAALKETLIAHGAFYASMSGSGSTVYGLFHSPPSLEAMPGVISHAARFE